ncbi:MAG: hypothetical protein K6C96_00540 [Butyrivibrio sp.]|nr:hypothetical protein [Butyrivibrio sp.]
MNYEGTAACAVGAVNGGEVSVSGSVNYQEIYDQTQTSHAVVAINNGSGGTNKQGGKVTVGGNICDNKKGIPEGSDSRIIRNGVVVGNDATAIVNGNITTRESGVVIYEGSGTAIVNGDVTADYIGVGMDMSYRNGDRRCSRCSNSRKSGQSQPYRDHTCSDEGCDHREHCSNSR